MSHPRPATTTRSWPCSPVRTASTPSAASNAPHAGCCGPEASSWSNTPTPRAARCRGSSTRRRGGPTRPTTATSTTARASRPPVRRRRERYVSARGAEVRTNAPQPEVGYMARRYDCSDASDRAAGLREAASAVRRGELVVLPTDTVYGIGADAFNSEAVGDLLAAKGRGRNMPSPVLVGSPNTLHGLVTDFSELAWELVDAFWPGALTLVARHQPSLQWDLGDTRGTVAVRMPLHPV